MVTPVKRVSRRDFIYLLLGNDSLSKEERISQVRKENVSGGTAQFNLSTIYANEVSAPKLKEALNSLPTGTSKRFLVIKNPEKFSSVNKEVMLTYLKNPQPDNLIIFDTREFDIKDNPFLLNLAAAARVINFQKGKPFNGFDLGRAINQGNPKLALNILSDLLSRGEKPIFVLGGILSQWAKNYNKGKLLKGYEVILETDRAIKTGRLKPKLGLEILVLKLSAGGVNPLERIT